MKITKKAFEEAVEAAADRRRLSERMPRIETIEIDFDARRVVHRGRTINVEHPILHIPIRVCDD